MRVLLNDKHGYISHIYQKSRNKLNRLGAPFEVFSFNDLAKADLSNYKMFVFPGLFEVTLEKAEVLKKHVFNKNRTAVFVYAPGLSDGKSLDTARVKALTGTEFKKEGVSTVDKEGWTSVYLPDYKTLTPEVLRKAAVGAGVTIYCDDLVPVYANERYVAVHMAKGGKKRVSLPMECRKVKELYTGKEVAVKDGNF